MVITLDSGQTVTIYENQNIFPQIKEYIDSELYELILKNCTGQCGETIEELEDEIVKLEHEVSEYDDDNDILERELSDKEYSIKQLIRNIKEGKIILLEDIIKKLGDMVDE
jgi:predicted RNase H-like nuclease (RuvC/YqgF family)